jgi:hypothetical protein
MSCLVVFSKIQVCEDTVGVAPTLKKYRRLLRAGREYFPLARLLESGVTASKLVYGYVDPDVISDLSKLSNDSGSLFSVAF